MLGLCAKLRVRDRTGMETIGCDIDLQQNTVIGLLPQPDVSLFIDQQRMETPHCKECAHHGLMKWRGSNFEHAVVWMSEEESLCQPWFRDLQVSLETIAIATLQSLYHNALYM